LSDSGIPCDLVMEGTKDQTHELLLPIGSETSYTATKYDIVKFIFTLITLYIGLKAYDFSSKSDTNCKPERGENARWQSIFYI